MPESIYRLLAEAAQRERRSLAQQTIALLAEGLNADADPQTRRCKLLDEIEQREAQAIELTRDPVDLIREERDR